MYANTAARRRRLFSLRPESAPVLDDEPRPADPDLPTDPASDPPADESSLLLTGEALPAPAAPPAGHHSLVPAPPHSPNSLLDLSAPEPVELLITSTLTGEVETVRVDAPVILIGRSARCDLRLIHPDVSGRHACLYVLRGGVLCLDLESRTGVHANDARRPAAWLGVDRAVRIGPFELRLAGPVSDVPPARQIEPETLLARCLALEPDRPVAGLDVFDGRTGKRISVPLVRPITLIGRGEHCKLRLMDGSVSLVHSSVLVAADGVWVTDLLGRGGVRLNGELVTRARLSPGDDLRIGRLQMTFIERTESQPHQAEVTLESSHAPLPTFDTPSLPATGVVSESLMLAMAETFAEMQRQMNEQFRMQMELMAGLVESVRSGANAEISAELSRVARLCDEIRETQRALLAQPKRLAAPAEPIEPAPPPIEPAAPPGAAQDTVADGAASTPCRPSRPTPAAGRKTTAVADHARLVARLRELERERSSRWQRLARMLKPNG